MMQVAATSWHGYPLHVERTRVWRGKVKPEARDQHEQFVTWLGTDEAKLQYAKFLLTGYELGQQGDDLTVRLSAEEPPAIIRFLRNPRMWPNYWEYVSAGNEQAEIPADTLRVHWRKADPTTH
jgi:hypothetical protein